ncbi:MAG TPA: sulfotransferase [Acidimicrobiia bacterium]|nr:sulfotransferase [Acidimicrobiia bacterium]
MERGPIFVAGLERSGTSLIYALLASHPSIAMTRRTNLWTHFYDQYGDLDDDANLDRCLATMARYKRLVVLAPDFVRLREQFVAGERTYARLFDLFERQHAQRLGRPRWGDKSLHTERWAEPILDAYAGARILHMIRDPRDRYSSAQTRWKLRRGGIGGGTEEWLGSARLAMRNEQRHPDRYRAVRYEDLARHPEETVRAMCAFIDEPYAPEMLAMEGAPRLLEQGSNSSYGTRPAGVISTDSIGKFRSVLTPRQIAFMQHRAASEMAHFGYEQEPVRLSLADGVGYRLVTAPLEAGRSIAWRTRDQRLHRAGRTVPSYRLVDDAAAGVR